LRLDRARAYDGGVQILSRSPGLAPGFSFLKADCSEGLLLLARSSAPTILPHSPDLRVIFGSALCRDRAAFGTKRGSVRFPLGQVFR
jgi:hypothetical protein